MSLLPARPWHRHRPRAQRMNLPAAPPVTDEDAWIELVCWGGVIAEAERGIVTELIRPDGSVAARVVPA